MDSNELRALQAPLKARYKEDPAAALVTLEASGDVGGEGIACSVQTGRALARAGLHSAAPVGFKDVRLRFELDTDATPEEMDKLLSLTERYCVVYQTLRAPPAISVTRS